MKGRKKRGNKKGRKKVVMLSNEKKERTISEKE